MTESTTRFTLIYRPELARALRELDVCHPAEAAILLNQLCCYWLQKDVGSILKDGRRWIYNSYADWIKTQITSLSEWQFGKMIRQLRSLGLILTSCYANLRGEFLDEPGSAWHDYNTSTWVTVDEEAIVRLTGWNPFGTKTKPKPPQSPEPSTRTEIANAIASSCAHNNVGLRSQEPSIYKKNSISTKNSEPDLEKEDTVLGTNTQEVSTEVEVDKDTRCESHRTKDTSTEPESSSQDSFSAAQGCEFVDSSTPQENSTPQPVKRGEVQKEVWEIAPGEPYPVFLNWRAKTKYEPQGGRWATDAIGNAYSEFYNNRAKTKVAIFPDFLAYMQTVAENANEQQNAGLKAILPSLLIAKPAPTEENVQRLMSNIQALIDRGSEVATNQGIATPSCTQSMSYQEATSQEIAPLAELAPLPALPPDASMQDYWSVVEQRQHKGKVLSEAVSPKSKLELTLETKQMLWRSAPKMRGVIRQWAENTPGVVMGSDGPELAAKDGNADMGSCIEEQPTAEELEAHYLEEPNPADKEYPLDDYFCPPDNCQAERET